MTDPTDRFDTRLHELFEREHAQPPAEPFLRETARRVAVARSRRILARRAAQGVALAALILASPWLIKGSAFVSTHLDTLLGTLTEQLFTPVGSAAVFFLGVIGVVLVQARKTRRIE
jgi:hypothetical protein